MKLIRYGEPGMEKPGVMLDGNYYDASPFITDYDDSFFANEELLKTLAGAMHDGKLKEIKPSRLGAPVYKPGKIICIGLNYRKHAAESGMEVPTEPVVFFKATSSVTGPNDNIILPKNSEKTDWEVELALVIGRRANYVSKEEAMDHVAGYVLHNDVSERAFQLERGGQWVKGKSADTFAPLGPFLATKDEINDPHNIKLWLKLNGETVQNGNTSDFIFDIPTIVSYLSQFMSLMPGDIVSTGTPPGVGLGFDPPRYLKPGDVVELGADGLGVSKQVVKAWQ